MLEVRKFKKDTFLFLLRANITDDENPGSITMALTCYIKQVGTIKRSRFGRALRSKHRISHRSTHTGIHWSMTGASCVASLSYRRRPATTTRRRRREMPLAARLTGSNSKNDRSMK